MTSKRVETFHQNSRLHFIGSWRARYEEFLDAKTSDASASAKNLLKKKPNHPPVIMHVDMDCFFASVATRNDEELRSKPVAVTWGTTKSQRGEISSCNYRARAFGVRAGMWLDEALRACPTLVTLPYDFSAYEATALEVYEILWAISGGEVVGVSCDEAYVDASERSAREGKDPLEVAEEIRRQVRARTGCSCSVGIGSNMLLARLATRRAKPDGTFFVAPAMERAFIAATLVEDIPGVGRTAGKKLEVFGAKTCGELLRVPVDDVRRAIGGKLAEKLLDAARGVDKTPWRVRPERKSVGAQMSWGVRCATDDIAQDFVRQLANEVSQRMQRLKIRGGRMFLKVWRAIPDVRTKRDYQGHGACDVLTRSKPMLRVSNDTEIVANEALSLLRELRVEATLIRGLGVSVNKLEGENGVASPTSKRQPTLFQMFRGDEPEAKAELNDETLDSETSDEDVIETQGEEDVANTQELTQNECDFALFNDSQAEIDSDLGRSMREAFASAARAYAWQSYELTRLSLSKRRRETYGEDEYAKRATSSATDVILAHARRSYLREGASGLSAVLDDARALCRSHELLHEKYSSQGAAFIAAWLDRVDTVERLVSSSGN